MKLIFLIVFTVTLAVPLPAATDSNQNGVIDILVPIAFSADQEIPGAAGSLWSMEFWLHNGSDTGLETLQPTSACAPPCEGTAYPADQISRIWSVANNKGAAAILKIRADLADEFSFSARLLETTRRAQPTGVDLPVIREQDFFRDAVTFIAIPAGPSIRSTLRVFDPRLVPGSMVRVDVLDDAGELIATQRLFPGNDALAMSQDRTYQSIAGYDAIFDLTASFPILANFERYHLRVTPETADFEYWAMVSVTDNESQHVLLITAK